METQEDILKTIINNIENSDSQDVYHKKKGEGYELFLEYSLTLNLSGGVGAFFIRFILHKMQINEHHLFKWRLENKYLQYLILNFYCPGCQPTTFSLSRVLWKDNGVSLAKELFARGFFLKATLGDGSRRDCSYDRTRWFDQITVDYDVNFDVEEKWILQKKITVVNEYRIHTFGRDIVHGITFLIKGHADLNQLKAESFLIQILNKLPDTIMLGSLVGWDVGLDVNGKFYVIEANFTGFHPMYRRGYQTSGYVEHNSFGPLVCAWLNCYWKYNYGTYIHSFDPSLLSQYPFYKDCLYFIELFNQRHYELISSKNADTPLTAVIYWGDISNEYVVTLVRYLIRLHEIDFYYLIIKEEGILTATDQFHSIKNISLIIEKSLFTDSQYLLINQLNLKRRRQICCYHAIREKKLDDALMF